jgi:nucleobase:cation symporter-1, NCS1 family
LYKVKGAYTYKKGFNNLAIIALLLGILPNVPGFLTTIGVMSKDAVWPWLDSLYSYAWFVGFFVSGICYLLMMKPASAPVHQGNTLASSTAIIQKPV